MRDAVMTYVAGALQRIRRHPFIIAANAQTLTREQATRWIFCAGRESRSFPHILENLVARSTRPRVRALLQANLDDEYGNGNPDDAHFFHYLQLLDELGVPRATFYEYPERAGIKLAVALAFNISDGNEAVAIGYMTVNEAMTPITHSAAHNALRRYHPAMRAPFLRLHVEVDERHAESLYAATADLDRSQLEDVLFGIDLGERGMAVLLDEALGILDACKEIPRKEASEL
ncbi:MAG: iron-containing redox enzyme family protein [bacterium]